MTREEIKKFDYSAFISLAQQDENIREALMREGYNIEDLYASVLIMVDLKKPC